MNISECTEFSIQNHSKTYKVGNEEGKLTIEELGKHDTKKDISERVKNEVIRSCSYLHTISAVV
jgi:hypothetical protein